MAPRGSFRIGYLRAGDARGAMLRLLAVALLLPLAGCAANDAPSTATPTPSASPTSTPTATGAAHEFVLSEATFILGPAASSVPPFDGSVTLGGLNVTANLTHVAVETIIDAGTSVDLRFEGPGTCSGAIPAAEPFSRHRVDCGDVPPGTYDVVYRHDSGEVQFTVRVLATGPA